MSLNSIVERCGGDICYIIDVFNPEVLPEEYEFEDDFEYELS